MHPFLVRPEHLDALERIRALLERLRDLSERVGGGEEPERVLGEVLSVGEGLGHDQLCAVS